MSFHCDEEEKRRQAPTPTLGGDFPYDCRASPTVLRLEYFLPLHSMKPYPDTDSPAHPFQLVV